MRFFNADVERATGFPLGTLATWRKQGHLAGVGELGENGRHSYSISDLIAFFLFDALREDFTPVASSLGQAFAYAPHLIAHIRGDGPASQIRYLAFTNTMDGDAMVGATLPLQTLAELDGEAFFSARIFDLRAVAAKIPELYRAIAKVG